MSNGKPHLFRGCLRNAIAFLLIATSVILLLSVLGLAWLAIPTVLQIAGAADTTRTAEGILLDLQNVLRDHRIAVRHMEGAVLFGDESEAAEYRRHMGMAKKNLLGVHAAVREMPQETSNGADAPGNSLLEPLLESIEKHGILTDQTLGMRRSLAESLRLSASAPQLEIPPLEELVSEESGTTFTTRSARMVRALSSWAQARESCASVVDANWFPEDFTTTRGLEAFIRSVAAARAALESLSRELGPAMSPGGKVLVTRQLIRWDQVRDEIVPAWRGFLDTSKRLEVLDDEVAWGIYEASLKVLKTSADSHNALTGMARRMESMMVPGAAALAVLAFLVFVLSIALVSVTSRSHDA